MKKIIACVLVLLLLAVPVFAQDYHIHDDSGLLQDHRCLEHLDHECGLSAGDVVRGADACEYLVAVVLSWFLDAVFQVSS